MSATQTKTTKTRIKVSSLEADMAFFEARLSLAGESPDTVYQLAQIKTYRTLGLLLGNTLSKLRPSQTKKRREQATRVAASGS